jgi:hypothetical protein
MSRSLFYGNCQFYLFLCKKYINETTNNIGYRNAIWRFRNPLWTQNEQNKNRQLQKYGLVGFQNY